ncbi:MAG: hypothetical protein A3I93_03495 [Candidatus Magasanikbacteria bacterium RIFCSPLOWO2_02_FULL_43_22]|nr:MAG: hypothetical protein A3I93_03495 [Candidatus Magasanikbacteria bacterium RIFCSPLOWO2_02_FULL_43_22]
MSASGTLNVAVGGAVASTSTSNGGWILGNAGVASAKLYIGSVGDGTGGNYPGLWMGQATPSLTNYAFLVTGSDSIFNAPTGENIFFRINNANKMTMDGTGQLSVGVDGAAGLFALGKFYINSSGNVSTSGTLSFTATAGGVVSSTANTLRLVGTPSGTNNDFEFWNGLGVSTRFLGFQYAASGAKASTTITSYISNSAGSAGFVLNTVAGGGTMTSSTVLDRALLAVQNNGVNQFVVGAGGNVYADESFIANSTDYGIADMAEYVNLTTGETGEPGDVLVVDMNNPNQYKKSSSAYTKEIAGVISDTGAFLMGASGEGRVPLALAGLVKTKVTDENGPIVVGDYLVSASKPGYAMRYDSESNKSAGLVGMALEPLAEGEGKITIMINKGLVNGGGSSATLTVNEESDGTLTNSISLDIQNKSLLSVRAINNEDNLWYIDETGLLVAKNIKADSVQAKKFVVKKNNDNKQTSVGEATILNNSTLVKVENELVTSKVKIFITFRSNPNAFWWISKQEEGTFEVSLSELSETDLTFDYWIIGTENADEESMAEDTTQTTNETDTQPEQPVEPTAEEAEPVAPAGETAETATDTETVAETAPETEEATPSVSETPAESTPVESSEQFPAPAEGGSL